jgi:CRISPR-associated endoribonuclease Cas6
LTAEQAAQVASLVGAAPDRVVELPVQFDEALPFAPQVRSLVERAGLDARAWQSTPLLVMLPSLNFIAAALLAELHGRMGYFPPVVRTRPVTDRVPRTYEVAEILDLQSLIAVKLLLTTDKPAALPPFLGRAVYAAVLARLAEGEPGPVAQLHDDDGPKPLTCSDLLGRDGKPGVTPGRSYAVRITGLGAQTVAMLTAAFLDAPPTHLELDGVPLQVVGSVCDDSVDPWTGRADFAALAATHLAAPERPPRQVTVEFASPTTFKSGGKHVPIPLPDLVFGSLVERWNSFSPVALSPDVRRFGAEMVAISRYHLRSVAVAHKQGGLRMGGVGRVTYAALSQDRYWMGALHLLAAFARFSGVGSQTTMGMGQARGVDARSASRE